MGNQQNPTNVSTPATVSAGRKKQVMISPQQESYITFCSIQGMVVEEDGTIRKMTAQQFADRIGVHRDTLYDWQKRIPNFWDLVAKERKRLGGQNRVAKVYNGLFLKAAKGDAKAAAIYLANHDPNFRMPAQKVEHEAGNSWAALLQQKRKNASDVIEGEVVDAS